MGFLDKLFGKKRSRAGTGADAPPVARSAGMETLQTADQQAATRKSMENEMDAQRTRRDDAAGRK